MVNQFKPHLFVDNIHQSHDYTRPSGGGGSEDLPLQNRDVHGKQLIDELQAIWQHYEHNISERKDAKLPVKTGEYFTFTGIESHPLKLDSLSSSGATLLNVKKTERREEATIYIPQNKKEKLLQKIGQYCTELTAKNVPKHRDLIDRIESVQQTTVNYLWSSSNELIPTEEALWCELWLAYDEASYTIEVNQKLIEVCEFYAIQMATERTFFPERVIIKVKASKEQLQDLIVSVDLIAEIRKAEELNSFWFADNQTTNVREEWINEALGVIDYKENNNYITILDSGVNNGHLLLCNSLSNSDRYTVDPNWGVNDSGSGGHGSAMAGIALYPNLNAFLERRETFSLSHRLESIKILPSNGNNSPETSWHFITENAFNIGTIENPLALRTYCMAVTAVNQNEFGKPSTWSATIDKIVSGSEDGDRKLFVISGGNVREGDWLSYPDTNLNSSVESPAQAWNAITVGAFTAKVLPNRDTVAKQFELSPFSRTSSSWGNSWPIKPEVVFEGGNLILNENSVNRHDDLELLTTSSRAEVNALTTINATSAATALAANFLARLRTYYPEAWSETLRALMIHSASWTQQMIDQFSIDKRSATSKKDLLKIVGYGIPNFEKAFNCSTNYLTFISEQTIQPYRLEGSNIVTNEIHYYEFPWPADILMNLGGEQVKLKITLSYFIEPNPGDKGYSTKYAYQSTALEFKLIKPTEDMDQFKARINKIDREEGFANRSTPDNRWFYSSKIQGSIRSNYWEGTAADIAVCNKLAVFPKASGWWKNLKKQNRYNHTMRYSLIVSIETPKIGVDIYTEIANQIAVGSLIEI